MTPARKRRAGATATIGVSLDPGTKRTLKALAAERHRGNVSALITEMTAAAARQAAFERAWRWYGGPDPDDATRAAIDAEFDAGWASVRRARNRKRRRPTTAA
jgi:hypothetical protein